MNNWQFKPEDFDFISSTWLTLKDDIVKQANARLKAERTIELIKKEWTPIHVCEHPDFKESNE